MSYINIREEELKNKVASDYFSQFDTTKIIGNVDFCASLETPNFLTKADPLERVNGVAEILSDSKAGVLSYLWAEAKRGKSDIYKSITQLILTIGRARTFDRVHPPAFLGAFDSFGIAFIPYNCVQEIFYQNDFNWQVTPSNYDTKEFKQIHQMVKNTIEKDSLIFSFEKDNLEIQEFIRTNFIIGKNDLHKIPINKNNFLSIYLKWLANVKPSIVANWDIIKKKGIIDGDFYLADLLSSENLSLKEKLFVILKKDCYEFDRIIDEDQFFSSKQTNFNDNQKSHLQFWNKYLEINLIKL